jgi:hypothetical protein
MTTEQKLYYCAAIYANNYRYSWGRQANRTLKDIRVPDIGELPAWIAHDTVTKPLGARLREVGALSTKRSVRSRDAPDAKLVQVSDLFTLTYGHSLELNALAQSPVGVNFVSRTSVNNGVSARITPPRGLPPAKPGLITVACGGSVMESFVQVEPFYSGRDIYWLEAKDALTFEEKLFYCACIRANRFRYNFGRQANKTLPALTVPARLHIPDWVYGSCKRISETLTAAL